MVRALSRLGRKKVPASLHTIARTGELVQPVCLFCGRDESLIPLVRANMWAQPGIFACTDHVRQDGWVNWPHTKAPFDLGYPTSPTIN